MSVTVKNLSKKCGSQKAVNHISFSLNKGEIIETVLLRDTDF